METAVFVEEAEISGVKPAVLQYSLRTPVLITVHHGSCPDQDLSVISDRKLTAGTGSHGQRITAVMMEGDAACSLCESVALMDFDAHTGKLLDDGFSCAGRPYYHETKIMSEEKEAQRDSYIALLSLTLRVMECGISLLGFTAPEKM